MAQSAANRQQDLLAEQLRKSTAPLTSNEAAGFTPDQQKVLNHALEFYRKIGEMNDLSSAENARRLRHRISKGQVSFGNVPPSKGNAETDAFTGNIVFSDRFISQVLSGNDPFLAQAEFAATVVHELRHASQDSVYITASNAAESIGKINAAETDAVGDTFREMTKWIRLHLRVLNEKQNANAPPDEIYSTAKELDSLCRVWSVYWTDAYDGRRKGIGEFSVLDLDGVDQQTLDEVKGRIDELLKLTTNLIAPGEAWNGFYGGTCGIGYHEGKLVTAMMLEGEIMIRIKGRDVYAKVKGRSVVAELLNSAKSQIESYKIATGQIDPGARSQPVNPEFGEELIGTIDDTGALELRGQLMNRTVLLKGLFRDQKGKGVIVDLNGKPVATWSVTFRGHLPRS